MNKNALILILIVVLASACSEQKEQEKGSQNAKESIEQEPEDAQLTEALSQKLLNTSKTIGLKQESTQEAFNKDNMKKLSEEDRQALIDLTIEQGAKNIKEDADRVMGALEKNTRENVDKR